MGQHITNHGGGVVVGGSNRGNIGNNNVIINNYSSATIDYETLARELEKLAREYGNREPEDGYGVRNIKEAAECSKNKDSAGLKAKLKKMSAYMVDLARDLSLNVLANILTSGLI